MRDRRQLAVGISAKDRNPRRLPSDDSLGVKESNRLTRKQRM
jgi:hypothetical protein